MRETTRSIKRASIPIISAIILGLSPNDLSAQSGPDYLVTAEPLGTITSDFLRLGLIAAGAYLPDKTVHDVSIYKLTYHTVDVAGNPTVASGALYVPRSDADSLPLISYQHGTIMNRDQVPSNRAEDPPGLFFSGYGYIVAMPDYLGLGDNPGLHPYLHWESEATASIDMVRAAREFLLDSLGIKDDALFLAGYSQGGHATMAMHRYVHLNQLDEEFSIEASAPMSGPYALSGPQFEYIFSKDSTYSGSYFIPYIIASYQLVYGNLYTDYSQYYDPPYDSIFAAWEASGIFFDNYPIDSFPENFYVFMQDSVLDHVFEDPSHPLNEDLRENDLYDWAPKEPVRMLYCGMDLTVSPENAIFTQEQMNLLGAADVLSVNVNPDYNHTTCAIPAFMYALEWFDGFSENGAVSALTVSEQPVVSLYPNPVSRWLTIETEITDRSMVSILSMDGQQVVETPLEGPVQQIDLSRIPKGVYVLTIRSGSYVISRKIVKL